MAAKFVNSPENISRHWSSLVFLDPFLHMQHCMNGPLFANHGLFLSQETENLGNTVLKLHSFPRKCNQKSKFSSLDLKSKTIYRALLEFVIQTCYSLHIRHNTASLILLLWLYSKTNINATFVSDFLLHRKRETQRFTDDKANRTQAEYLPLLVCRLSRISHLHISPLYFIIYSQLEGETCALFHFWIIYDRPAPAPPPQCWLPQNWRLTSDSNYVLAAHQQKNNLIQILLSISRGEERGKKSHFILFW